MDQLPESYERIGVPSVAAWHVWVLSDHYEPVPSTGGRRRTYLGELTYAAKYGLDRRALELLTTAAQHCVRQLRLFPPRADALSAVTAVTAVPCYSPKDVSVPHAVAQAAAHALGVPDISSTVVKTRETPAAKSNPGLHPDAYEARVRLDGQYVLLVDDLYRTGTTLESVAVKLRAAGAAHIVGLCITKAHKGMVQ